MLNMTDCGLIAEISSLTDNKQLAELIGVELVGAIFTPEPDQNHPFTVGGCRSSLSQPLKSQRRPEVQM